MSIREGVVDEGACAPSLALLSGFRLECDGGVCELPLSTQRLIAFLAVHNRPLQRLFVAGNLWIDSSESRANASLRTALWRLRRIGFRVVEATRSHLALDRSISVDLHVSTEHARRLLRHDGSTTFQAVDGSLFAGELLPDWYDDWVLIERERFRQLRLHALETLCVDLTAAGSHAEAVEVGIACVCAEPLRESAHRALIGAHISEGNVGEAVRQYRIYRGLLRDELGLAPSVAIRQMVESLPFFDGVVTPA
jgi:DNA-binding SARP family transcriptional activator